MSNLTNPELARQYPKDSVWVVETKKGTRIKVLYHGNDINTARKLNSEAIDSILIRKKLG